MNMKCRMHLRFCSNPPRGCSMALGAPAGPPVAFDEIRVPKKAMTLREQQRNEYEKNDESSQFIFIQLDKYYHS